MKTACCTYCSIEITSSPEPIAAVKRWGTRRVQEASRFARDNGWPFFLLIAGRGLTKPEDPVPPGGANLDEDDIHRNSLRVADQLQKEAISHLQFLVSPLNRLSLAYLRVIVLACDRANIVIELRNHEGQNFEDWSKIYRQAEEARLRVIKGTISVEEAFQPLFKKYDQDGMLWFKRAQAFEYKGSYAQSLGDFRRAAELFPMREWKDAAKRCAESISSRFAPVSGSRIAPKKEVAEIERLVTDAEVRRLSIEAFRVAVESPSACILLCRTALRRIESRSAGFPLPLERQKRQLVNRRNTVEHGSVAGTRTDAEFCMNALLTILRTVYARR